LVCLSYTCVFGETKRINVYVLITRVARKLSFPFTLVSLSRSTLASPLFIYLSVPSSTGNICAPPVYGRCARAETAVINDGVLGHEWLMIPTWVNAQLAWIDHSSWRASCLPCRRFNAYKRTHDSACVCVCVCVCVLQGHKRTQNDRYTFEWTRVETRRMIYYHERERILFSEFQSAKR